jgi:hypothetical protein
MDESSAHGQRGELDTVSRAASSSHHCHGMTPSLPRDGRGLRRADQHAAGVEYRHILVGRSRAALERASGFAVVDRVTRGSGVAELRPREEADDRRLPGARNAGR